jgi:flagellar biosynthesis chaperone FliJ
MEELDNCQNNAKPSGFELVGDVNEEKLNHIDKTYQTFKENLKQLENELNELNHKTNNDLTGLDIRRKGCLNVIVTTLNLELSYFNEFKKQLENCTDENINIEIS